jgi:hypothetical protein
VTLSEIAAYLDLALVKNHEHRMKYVRVLQSMDAIYLNSTREKKA